MSPEQGFAVVIRDDDLRLSRHLTTEGARAEAKRLAEKVRGHRFYVLQAVAVAQEVTPVEVVDVLTDDVIPF